MTNIESSDSLQRFHSHPPTAPRNDAEEKLVAVWQRLFRKKEIGIYDDFFALGGDLPQATELFGKIEALWGCALPPSTLFKKASIAELAEMILSSSDKFSELITIQPLGTKPPLFCIHAIDGDVFSYRNLVPYLGGERPVHGIRFPYNLVPANECLDIDWLAEHYITLVREIQPQGPYFFAGHSFGGLVAYEMSRKLTTQGEKVGLVGLIDTEIPDYFGPPSLSLWFRRRWANFRKVNWRDWAGYLSQRVIRLLGRWIKKTLSKGGNAMTAPSTLVRRGIKIYKPGQYAGKVVLFRAAHQLDSVGSDYDATLGWSQYLGDRFRIEVVPGNHGSIIAEPHVRVLASRLRNYMEEADLS